MNSKEQFFLLTQQHHRFCYETRRNKEGRRHSALLAARLAERFVKQWLDVIGRPAEDLSIQQISPQNDGLWRTADLRSAEGMLFDVKNSIRHDAFIETFIQKIKSGPLGHDVVSLTLLAHCSDCGSYPLMFGREETCTGCGRLICVQQGARHGCMCAQAH
jgi:hypothetical protein